MQMSTYLSLDQLDVATPKHIFHNHNSMYYVHQYSFSLRTIHNWNGLPQYIVDALRSVTDWFDTMWEHRDA